MVIVDKNFQVENENEQGVPAEKRNKTIKHFTNLATLLGKTVVEVSEIYRELKTIETMGNKKACDYCNGDINSDEWEVFTEKIKNRLSKIIPADVLKNVKLNGDPRGYFLKLDDEYVRVNDVVIERDWGGHGIFAPEGI